MIIDTRAAFFKMLGSGVMAFCRSPCRKMYASVVNLAVVPQALPTSKVVHWDGTPLFEVNQGEYAHWLVVFLDECERCDLFELIVHSGVLRVRELTCVPRQPGCAIVAGSAPATVPPGMFTKDWQFEYWMGDTLDKVRLVNVGNGQTKVTMTPAGTVFPPEVLLMRLSQPRDATFSCGDGYGTVHNLLLESSHQIVRSVVATPMPEVQGMSLFVENLEQPMRYEWTYSRGDLPPPYAPDPTNVTVPRVRIGDMEISLVSNHLRIATVAKAAGATRAMLLTRGCDQSAVEELNVGVTPVTVAIDEIAGINEYYLTDVTSGYRIVVAELPKIQSESLPGVLLWVQHMI